jgi:hypothetical protein
MWILCISWHYAHLPFNNSFSLLQSWFILQEAITLSSLFCARAQPRHFMRLQTAKWVSFKHAFHYIPSINIRMHISPPESDSDKEGHNKTDTGCTQQTDITHSRSVPVIHKFRGVTVGWDKKRHPYINKDSSPLTISMLFFLEIMKLSVEKTITYYHQ